MNKLIKRFLLFVIAISLIPGMALANTIIGFETPADGQTIGGRIQISGWAVDPDGIDEVYLYIDDREKGIELAYGSSRGDVASAYPDIADSLNSGFSGIYNTRLLSNGAHLFRIEVEDEKGEKTSVMRAVVVSNEPGEHWPPPQIDLSQVTSRVVNSIIFLDNVLIDGKAFNNLDLVFDPKTRQFSFSAFDDDLDGDGYHDDDLDEDGYHDDDEDQDGFHDSDENSVQPGIPMPLAEIKGEVISVNGETIVVFSDDPEHGGAVGEVTIDISNAVLDDNLNGTITIGDTIEAEGSWDGYVLAAIYVERDDDDDDE